MTAISALGRAVLCGFVRAYQWVISPLFAGSCRYYPTCSSYAIEAISTHGAARGLWLATRRLMRCHPWGSAGVDPVPAIQGADALDRPVPSCHHHAEQKPDAA